MHNMGRLAGAAFGIIGLKVVQIFRDHTAIFTPLQNKIVPSGVIGDAAGPHAQRLVHALQLLLRAVALSDKLAQVEVLIPGLGQA